MSGGLESVANPPLVAALLSGDPEAVTRALAGATLLIPASSGGGDAAVLTPARGPGGRRVLPAFTDLEALLAWDRSPAPSAVALGTERVAQLLPAGTGALLLNPAGPGSCLIGGEVLATPSAAEPSRNGHGTGPAPADALVDPSARRPVREQARRAHQAAREARERGDFDAAAGALRESLEALESLKDHLHAASAAAELGACHVAAGRPEAAPALFADAGQRFAMLGELDLAVGALLDGAEAALDAGGPDEAQELSIAALELVAGETVSTRIVTLWGRLLER